NNAEDPPVRKSSDPADREDARLDTLVPLEPSRPYDIKDVIHAVVDEGRFLEVQPEYALNMVIGFARLDGRPVGVVANQPAHPAAARAAYIAEYREKFATPFKAAELGYIDEIIRPRQTRKKLIRSLHMLKNKRQDNPPRKHGNIPL